MVFLDFFGDFTRASHTCKKCGWHGLGADMVSGETFGDGVEKHCPRGDEYYRFAQWSVIGPDDPPDDSWKANIKPAEF